MSIEERMDALEATMDTVATKEELLGVTREIKDLFKAVFVQLDGIEAKVNSILRGSSNGH